MVLIVIVTIAVVALGVQSASAAQVKDFDVPNGAHPHDVAPAPDGNVWYTAQSQGALGILDPKTGKQLGLRTGEPDSFKSFDDLFDAWHEQFRHFLGIKLRGNQIIERMYAQLMPAPFLSVLTDDCVKRGRDYNAGGARYNNTYIQFVGLGSLTDSFSAMRDHCFATNGQARVAETAAVSAIAAVASCGKAIGIFSASDSNGTFTGSQTSDRPSARGRWMRCARWLRTRAGFRRRSPPF